MHTVNIIDRSITAFVGLSVRSTLALRYIFLQVDLDQALRNYHKRNRV